MRSIVSPNLLPLASASPVGDLYVDGAVLHELPLVISDHGQQPPLVLTQAVATEQNRLVVSLGIQDHVLSVLGGRQDKRGAVQLAALSLGELKGVSKLGVVY